MNLDKWDVVQLGRAVGAFIVVAGVVVAGWAALDQPEGFPADDSARLFIQNVLNYTFTGAMVVLVAEIAGRLGWGTGTTDKQEIDEIDQAEEAELPTD